MGLRCGVTRTNLAMALIAKSADLVIEMNDSANTLAYVH
jgi:hypothetical protein